EEERLTITMTNPNAKESKDRGKPGPRINITLPGKVLEANRNATVDGDRVSWSFGLVDFFREKTIELTARYQVAANDQPPSTDAPPPAKEPGEAQHPAAKP